MATQAEIVQRQEDHRNLPVVFQQTVTVAKSGADFTTIQGAIDSITDAAVDKQYTVLIYPGEYDETITGSDYVGLRGIGERGTVKIFGDTGPLYTFPDNGGDINDLRFSLAPTTTAQEIIHIPATAGADRKSIINCKFDYSTATNGVRGVVFDIEAGEVVVRDCEITYVSTGNSAGTVTHRVFDIDGDANVDVLACVIDVDIDDIDDNVIVYDDASLIGGDTHIANNVIHVTANNAGAYSGIVRCFNFLSTVGNIHLTGNTLLQRSLESGGTGRGEYVRVNSAAGGGIVNSVANHIIVSGFATNYWGNVAAGDLIVSHFDDIAAVDGTIGAGSFTYASSLIDGNTTATGIIRGGQIATPLQTATLGAGVTTLAITSNVLVLTGDGGGNTIATFTGGVAGQLLTIIFVDGLVTITDTDAHTANTVDLSAAFTSADDTVLQLVFDGTSWYEVSRSVN